jgi:hypothetical protein
MQPSITIPAFDAFLVERGLLFAFCDRRTDLADCLALAPTASELAEALPWLEAQDANEQWPQHVRQMLDELGGRLGHGL